MNEYETKKKHELSQAIIVYALIAGALAYGCCVAMNNIIPLVVWLIASGYLYNKATR